MDSVTSAEPRRRGRPRAYDPDVALRRARDVFWRTGYAATSLDDLATSMGMNRPSIYAGFGDKRALYHKVAGGYSDASRAWLRSALAGPTPLRDTLRSMYRNARDFYLAGDSAPRGCFLLGTAVTESTRDTRVRDIVESTMAAFTEAFAERFTRAKRDCELSAHPPDGLAQIAAAALNTISMRARSGAQPEVLDELIAATIDVICGRPD